ncbi:hypothetical protein KUH32_00425 [Thalassococcus sp. CAU 1522]|uniref:Hedgehog/Intein (Hint) domain-containing protein n=1 Tax=Thalassococcus arenae TaxID=2851652 RepID=A0ABS6N2I6_9RHOB|nr:hypothetical protein [Thalassococcus arenae]MBV2358226.1 hypothetical protein [Thalassococcus arenae]
MRRQLAGTTVKFDGRGHGTQIEYFHPDGTAHLWYPGNTIAVPSEWKVQAGSAPNGGAVICFRYPKSSYNPVVRQYGGRWECRPGPLFSSDITAIIRGDEFALRTGRIPRIMPRGALLSMAGVETLIGRSIRGDILFGR